MPTVFWLIGDRVGIRVQAWVLPMVPPAARGTSYPPDHAWEASRNFQKKRGRNGGRTRRGVGIWEREASLQRSTFLTLCNLCNRAAAITTLFMGAWWMKRQDQRDL